MKMKIMNLKEGGESGNGRLPRSKDSSFQEQHSSFQSISLKDSFFLKLKKMKKKKMKKNLSLYLNASFD